MNKTALLITHYNNPEGLKNSIQSIANTEQIDVVIVDDGSLKYKINQKAIENSFIASGKIYFKYLTVNQGIENALNFGLDFIILKKYKYVARLDCGDLCIGKRFEKQQFFLENNKNIKLLGSNVIAVDIKGNFMYNIKLPQNHAEIRKKMYLSSMFIHPSIMFSLDIIDKTGRYPTKYKSAEDYAFFFKVIKNFQTTNLLEPMVKIEINPHGISLNRRNQQLRNRIKIIIRNFYLGFWPIYGLLRNIILLIIPYKLIQILKKHQ